MRVKRQRYFGGAKTQGVSRPLAVPLSLSCLLSANVLSAYANAPGGHYSSFASPAASGHSALSQYANNSFSAVPSHQFQQWSHAGAAASMPVRFDLSSTTASFILNNANMSGMNSVQLDLGGTLQSFFAGDRVTAAEYAAITGGNTGSLVLDSHGRAVGGTLSLDSLSDAIRSINVSSLVISHGVTAVDNFAISPLNLSGNLVNYGSIYGISSDASALNGVINVHGLSNRAGATISTDAPAAILAAYAGTVAGADLTINAVNGISNAGTLSAIGNLMLSSGRGDFANSGLISSRRGDVIFGAPSTTANITINGVGGTVEALNGAVTVRDAAYTGAGNIYMTGGDYLSKNLNLYTGQGAIEAAVGNVTGNLNSQAQVEHFFTNSPTFVLGDNCVTGDPTFVNTAVGGTIVIDGINTFSQAVAILANGNITSKNGAQINNPGGNVTIIAGAKTSTGGTTTTGLPGGKATQNVTVSLDPAAGAGGDIDFSTGAAATVINTATGSNGGAAGNVTLIALASNGGNGGRVLLGTNDIDATASGRGNLDSTHSGGNVLIMAGSLNAGAAVTVGSIYTGGGLNSNGSPAASGSISIYTQQAKSSAANNQLVFDTVGNLTGGVKILPSGNASKGVGVTITGDLNSSGEGGTTANQGTSAGAITVAASGDVVAANLYAFGGGGGGAGTPSSTSSALRGGNGGNGAPITVTSDYGNITISGIVDTSGGGGGGGAGRNQQNNANGTAGGKGGQAADVSLSANNGALTVGSAIWAANGGDGGQGGKPKTNLEGGGGGGGGSLGGGGGGGGDAKEGGGGGGGGIFGGGGGARGGGLGGGGNAGGGGGTSKIGGPGNAGIALTGGNGAGNTGGNGGTGGGIGGGGTGASSAIYNENGFPGGGYAASTSKITITAGSDIAIGAKNNTIGGTVNINTANAGKVNLGGGVVAFQSASLKTGSGDITGASVSAPTLSITSSSGSVGTSGTPLAIDASKLSVSTGTGGGTPGVYLSGSGSVTLSLATAMNGTFSLASKTGIDSGMATIIADTVALSASNGAIKAQTQTNSLSAGGLRGVNISNQGELTITAGSATLGDFIIKETNTPEQNDTATITFAGTISASNISITSEAARGRTTGFIAAPGSLLKATSSISLRDGGREDIGTSTAPIVTQTPSLSVNGQGNVYLANTGSVTLGASTAGSGNRGNFKVVFSLINTADASGNGQIVIGGNVTAGRAGTPSGNDTTLILNSSETGIGKGGILNNGFTLTGDTILLTDGAAGAGTAPIGSAATPIKTEAAFLAANTQSNVFLKNTGAVTVLDSKLPAANTFALDSSGGIGVKAASIGTITAGTIILIATDNIGVDATTRAQIDGANVTLNSRNGSVFVTDKSAGPILLKNATLYGNNIILDAQKSFAVDAPNTSNLSNANQITGASISLKGATVVANDVIKATTSIDLSATGAGNLSVNKAITAPTITLGADSGTIVQLTDGIIKVSKLLTINITGGGTANLQNANNDVDTLADNVSGSGQVLLNVVTPINLGAISGDKQNLTVLYTGSLKGSSNFAVNQLTLTPSAGSKNSAIALTGTVSADAPAVLTANGTGSIAVNGLGGKGDKTLLAAGSGNITISGAFGGNQITLTTNGGDITQTATGIVTAAAAVIVNLNKAGTADLSKAPNSFTVFNDTVVGTGKVLVSSSQTLVLSSIVGLTQDLTVKSGDTIVTPNPIEAASLSITAGGAGGIGNPAQPVKTNATKLSLNDTAGGANIYAEGTNPAGLTLSASAAGANFTLTSAGPITTTGPVNGGNISFTSGGNGGITIGDKFGNAASLIVLSAPGTGSIKTQGATDQIFAQDLTINSKGGSIAGPATLPLLISANNVTLTTDGNGIVDVLNKSTNSTNLMSSASGLSFSYEANGPLNISGIKTNAAITAKTGFISIIENKGDLVILPGSNLTANGGNFTMQNKDVATGSILIGANTTILASSKDSSAGNVSIFLGAKGDLVAGTAPPNVTENITGAGKIYYGKSSITAIAPSNNLNALDRNIIFDTDKNSAAGIQLGGNVTITADPPEDGSNVQTFAAAAVHRALPVAPVIVDTVSFGSSTSAIIPVSALPVSASSAEPVVAITASRLLPHSGEGEGIFGLLTSYTDNWSRGGSARAIDADIVEDGVAELNLHAGARLFAPEQSPVTVKTRLGAVSIAPRSMVLMVALSHGIAVYNLDDTRPNAVTIASGQRQVCLAPGQHLFLTEKNGADFASVNPCERIAYKGVRQVALSETVTGWAADFHVLSAVVAFRPLSAILASHEARHERRAKHFLKTAAIMMQLSNGKSYKTYTRPQLTAWR